MRELCSLAHCRIEGSRTQGNRRRCRLSHVKLSHELCPGGFCDRTGCGVRGEFVGSGRRRRANAPSHLQRLLGAAVPCRGHLLPGLRTRELGGLQPRSVRVQPEGRGRYRARQEVGSQRAVGEPRRVGDGGGDQRAVTHPAEHSLRACRRRVVVAENSGAKGALCSLRHW